MILLTSKLRHLLLTVKHYQNIPLFMAIPLPVVYCCYYYTKYRIPHFPQLPVTVRKINVKDIPGKSKSNL